VHTNGHTNGAAVRVSFTIVSLCWYSVKLDPKAAKALPAASLQYPLGEEPIDSMMNLTLQLSFRIALVWAAGFLIAVAVEALLPDQAGINLAGRQSVLFIPFSRMGFWTCVLAALIVTALVVGRSMLADIGWNTFH
jgi:hypothetical protein